MLTKIISGGQTGAGQVTSQYTTFIELPEELRPLWAVRGLWADSLDSNLGGGWVTWALTFTMLVVGWTA